MYAIISKESESIQGIKKADIKVKYTTVGVTGVGMKNTPILISSGGFITAISMTLMTEKSSTEVLLHTEQSQVRLTVGHTLLIRKI